MQGTLGYAGSQSNLVRNPIGLLILAIKPARCSAAPSPRLTRFRILKLRCNRALGFCRLRAISGGQVFHGDAVLLHQVLDCLDCATEFIFACSVGQGLQFCDLFNILCIRRYSLSKEIGNDVI